jgi:hypothetical protein
MSKKSQENLLNENVKLKQEINNLKLELSQLNENTVISSMNDMKEKYEHLLNTTVCNHRFYNLKDHYVRNNNIIKTIDVVIQNNVS